MKTKLEKKKKSILIRTNVYLHKQLYKSCGNQQSTKKIEECQKGKKLLLLFRNDNTYMHLICFWGMPNIKIRRSVFIWTAKLTGIPGWLLETSFKMVVEFFKCFVVGRTIFTIVVIYMMFNDMHALKKIVWKNYN